MLVFAFYILKFDKMNDFLFDNACFQTYNLSMGKMLVDRVAFTLFGVDIYWYGVIITSAILLSFALMFVVLKRRGRRTDELFDLAICVLPLAILSARLFSVLFDAGLDLSDYFSFRTGGMSIIGAIIGGVLGILLFCAIKKKNFFDMADFVAPFLLMSQAIGRWGNYFNQEIYGGIVEDVNLQWFPYAVQIGGEWFQALFFYEFIFNLVGAILLFTLLGTCKKRGVITCVYMMFYGGVRFFLEDLRNVEYVLKWGNIAVSKLFSGLLFLVGFGILLFILFNEYFKHRKLSRSVRDVVEEKKTDV